MSNSKSFPVVGVGTSAGGLEALENFFTEIPHQSSIAFVVIQHLNPEHDSMMSSLLSKHTPLPIQVVQEGMALEPDVIYLNPPDKNVALVNGQFKLSEVNANNRGFFRIDHFFRSLAEDQGNNAICIVLSGTGSDGTIGLREVKSAGGMTMAQAEDQADYEGMPHSAVSTGMVDLVRPTYKMADELIQYIRHPQIPAFEKADYSLQNQHEALRDVFKILKTQTGHDFSYYKLNTIYRRIEKRMAVHQLKQLDDYINYLEREKSEVNTLFKDLLITVTSFFRDEEAFETLKQEAIPDLLDNLEDGKTLRIWVPGCATGEEAYALAIILIETMEEKQQLVECKIFASDIDNDSIEFARVGAYPLSITADVSKARLERFFILDGHQYQVKKRLRDMVIFAEQDLIKDPPFSQVDLISCRNVLIYMNQEIQQRLFPVFHYALNQNGILFLGASESPGEFERVFKPVDDKQPIYQKLPGNLNQTFDYPDVPKASSRQQSVKIAKKKPATQSHIQNLIERTILEKYSYPCAVLNKNYEILYLYGQTDQYLALPRGKASLNILNVAKESLRYKLLTTLKEALDQGKSSYMEDLQISHKNEFLAFDLIVHPLTFTAESHDVLLVVFKEKTPNLTIEKAKEAFSEDLDGDKSYMMMEQELNTIRESLQTTIEQLENSNEELQSKNEELQSTNEELQSSIEELETSKEEAQSTNEEMISVNSELKQKIADLAEAKSDINNLLASTEIATIFLDNELLIKRFTPAMENIFNLIPSDIGRPISDITSNINYQNIYEDAKHVLETLSKEEKEIQTASGAWYAVRLIPYRTTENTIDGVVITFIEITDNKQLKEASRLATVVKDSNDAILALDLQGNITAWNPVAQKMYGYTENEALQMNITDIIPENQKLEFKQLMERVQEWEMIPSFETRRITKSGEIVKIWLTVSALINNYHKTYAIVTTERQLENVTGKEGDS